MDFKYRAKDIEKIEKAKNEQIGKIAVDGTISSIALLIKYGTDCSLDRAYDIIDEEREKGKDTEELVLEIVEALTNQGFLTKELNIEKMKKAKASQMEMANIQLEKMI